MESPDEILTASEVARILKVSEAAVYRLRSRGRLQARFKLFEGERGWRWTREDLTRYLEGVKLSTEPVRLCTPAVRPVNLDRQWTSSPSRPYVSTKRRLRTNRIS